jgi:hypothetical protein
MARSVRARINLAPTQQIKQYVVGAGFTPARTACKNLESLNSGTRMNGIPGNLVAFFYGPSAWSHYKGWHGPGGMTGRKPGRRKYHSDFPRDIVPGLLCWLTWTTVQNRHGRLRK